MRLAVLATKGGVGKTTTAVATALALAADGARVLLVDCDDPQWSVMGWKDLADEVGESWPRSPRVQKWASVLTRSALDRYDHVVFDLGPKRPEMARSVLRLCDTAVIPTAPRKADFAELGPALDLIVATQSRQPLAFAVLLTMVRFSTRAGRQARTEVADELGLPVLDVVIPLAERYADMYGRVPTRLGAYQDLAEELLMPATDQEEDDVRARA